MIKKLLFLLLFCPLQSLSQEREPLSKDLREANAEYAFEDENYLFALPLFKQLLEEYPNNLNYKFKLGVCYIYKSDEHEKAIPLLEDVYAQSPNTKSILFYLGRAYHSNYKFDEALSYLSRNIEENPADDERSLTERYIKYCENGKILYSNPVTANIINFGKPVNSEASEYVPVLTADESVLIFTYRGEKSTGGLMNLSYEPDAFGQYYEDVFISYKENDSWTAPVSIGENINSKGHDAAIALSADGQKLFTYKNTFSNGGDVFMSVLDGTTWSTPQELKGNVNTKSWEGSVSLSSDEKTLYFASERGGGFGGKDLYKATLQSDGSWGNIENLGSNFNTEFDDDAPYIHPDGTIFHFSSNGNKSIGGYDIFRCTLKDGIWSAPENLGYPINTIDDDIYYVISANGEKGFYSSGKQGGFGLQDLYVVAPGIQGEKPHLVLVNGNITLNDQPIEANIEVTYASNNNSHGNFQSNSATGKYLFNLPSGTNYTITYKLNSLEPQIRTVEATDIDSFIEKTIDIPFYTPDYVKPQPKVEDTVAAEEQPVIPEPKTYTYQMYLDEFGDTSAEGLNFKVQIAAYKMPENYKYDRLKDLGTPEKLVLDDNVTRFTLGNFKTLKEADDFKKKVIDKGQTDAFVTAIYNGKRVYLKELYFTILKQNIPGRE